MWYILHLSGPHSTHLPYFWVSHWYWCYNYWLCIEIDLSIWKVYGHLHLWSEVSIHWSWAQISWYFGPSNYFFEVLFFPGWNDCTAYIFDDFTKQHQCEWFWRFYNVKFKTYQLLVIDHDWLVVLKLVVYSHSKEIIKSPEVTQINITVVLIMSAWKCLYILKSCR